MVASLVEVREQLDHCYTAGEGQFSGQSNMTNDITDWKYGRRNIKPRKSYISFVTEQTRFYGQNGERKKEEEERKEKKEIASGSKYVWRERKLKKR